MLHLAPIFVMIAAVAEATAPVSSSFLAAASRVVADDGANAPAQADPGTGAVKIAHENGATTLTLDNAQISLSNRLQFRFTNEMPASNVRLPGTTADGQSKPSFRVRRAKTTFEGWFWKKELTFELQLSWAGPEAGASSQTPLEDAMLTWDASKKGSFMISIGQFKTPLGRQEMTSSGRLQFSDRSLLSGEFSRGRDLGLQIQGRVANDKLAYHAGVFNGNAASRTTNDNTKLQYNARLSLEPFGKVSFSESAFEGWDKPLLALAFQFENNDLSGATNLTDLNTTVLGGDIVFKHKGFSLFAEYFNRKRRPEAISGSSPAGGTAAVGASKYHSNGYHIQAGYFLKRDTLEIAGRLAGYDPSDKFPSNNHKEAGGALIYYFLKHNFKILADFRSLHNDVDKETNKELRIQTQFSF